MIIKYSRKDESISAHHDIFHLHSPQAWQYPYFVDIPHASCEQPFVWVSNSNIEKNCHDLGIWELSKTLPQWGIPVQVNHVHRAYIDVNRQPHDLNPLMVQGDYQTNNNHKALAGRGLIWSHCHNGQPLFSGKLSKQEIKSRLDRLWKPYHDCLKRNLSLLHQKFNTALHINLHSMPAAAVSRLDPAIDIVVGDRFQQSATPEIAACVINHLENAGFRVAYNKPFPGDALLSYARPEEGLHAIQLEINRNIFWHEKRMAPSLGFVHTRSALRKALKSLAKDLNSFSPALPNRSFRETG